MFKVLGGWGRANQEGETKVRNGLSSPPSFLTGPFFRSSQTTKSLEQTKKYWLVYDSDKVKDLQDVV